MNSNVCDLEDQFSADVSSIDQLMRARSVPQGQRIDRIHPRNAAYTGGRMKNSAQPAIVGRKGTLEWFGMRLHMKLKAWNFFLRATLPAAGLAMTAQADVHVGIGIAVAP